MQIAQGITYSRVLSHRLLNPRAHLAHCTVVTNSVDYVSYHYFYSSYGLSSNSLGFGTQSLF